MAHENKVMRSIEDPNGVNCVDIYQRGDGSFGFAQFRRDPEDGYGWRPLAADSGARYGDLAAALVAARQQIGWLAAIG